MTIEPVTHAEALEFAQKWAADAAKLASNGVLLGAEASAAVGQAYAMLALALRRCHPWCDTQSGEVGDFVPPF